MNIPSSISLCRLGAVLVLLLAPSVGLPSDGIVERTGRVDIVVPDESRIVINDEQYRVESWTRVHHPRRSRGAGIDALAAGTWVRFHVDDEGPGRTGRVRELWVLRGKPPASTE